MSQPQYSTLPQFYFGPHSTTKLNPSDPINISIPKPKCMYLGWFYLFISQFRVMPASRYGGSIDPERGEMNHCFPTGPAL